MCLLFIKKEFIIGTSRLAGGGVEGNQLLFDNNTLRDMSCTSPTGAKAAATPRPSSRGICPAELNNIYGQNTKHLVC